MLYCCDIPRDKGMSAVRHADSEKTIVCSRYGNWSGDVISGPMTSKGLLKNTTMVKRNVWQHQRTELKGPG